MALGPCSVHASCLDDPTVEIRGLQALVADDAVGGLERVRERLDAFHANPSVPEYTSRLASLYSVQAEALGVLERLAEARAAALKGLQLAVDPHDPVRLELLILHAENVDDGASISHEITIIEEARRVQPRGSTAETCLLTTRGRLENRADRADLAIVSLTRAYAQSVASVVTEAHVDAAAGLSVVMRNMGDYEQALALNQEEIDWDTSRHERLNLSVARFMRGQILKTMGRYSDAIAEYTASRRLSEGLNDVQGVAYADLDICESHIDMGELAAAQQECDSAWRVFVSSQTVSTVKQARTLLARIDLLQGRPDKALAGLNYVLDHQAMDLPPPAIPSFYELRARANAALHKYRDAYADLLEFAHRYTTEIDAQRHQQAGTLRARFQTDREIERNALLKRELAVSQQQSYHQAQELKWNAIVVVVGLCVITLLVYFLLANRRYRQQLVRLASLDGLTGLPNRRHTAELATAALHSARASQEPLVIAIIDMDHFKIINDRCGHAAGDHVLKEFARAGGAALRASDILGRWGGEEFLLVMPATTLAAAVANLERLRTLVCGIRLPASGVGLRVSLSAGLAAFDATVKSLDDLIARADGALYEAKNDGRDLVRVANSNHTTGSHSIRRAQRQF